MAKREKAKMRMDRNALMLRVTGGELRGRAFWSPGTPETHPMGSREKMALFNMIAAELPGARVLDAFAGSGALGIEALSRGALEVTFVEKNPQVAKVIRKNLAQLGLTDRAEVVVDDVKNLNRSGFEVVLADPPYDQFEVAAIEGIGQFLVPGGILALSHPREAPVLEKLELVKTRKYARARISLYSS